MTPEKLITVSVTMLLVSLGLCGVNAYLVLHTMSHGEPRPGYHEPFYTSALIPTGFIELAGMICGMAGLICGLIWKLVRRKRQKEIEQ